METTPTSSSDWINIIKAVVSKLADNKDTFNAMYEAIRRQSALLKTVSNAQARERGAFREIDEGMRELHSKIGVMEGTSTQVNNAAVEGFIQDLSNRVDKLEEGNSNESIMKSFISELRESKKGGTTVRRSIMDYKAISLLNKIESRSGYKAWNDRLINALSQVIEGAREVMKYLMKCAERNVIVDTERKWTHSATDALAGMVATASANSWADAQSYQQWNEDLYCILVETCDGEAYGKVKTVQEGDGVAAYCIVHRYFTEISGYGTTLRAQQLIFPPAPKSEGHIAECIDKWLENVRSFEAMDKSYYLAIPYKIEALRCLMAGPRARMAFEHVENAKRIMHIDEALRPEAFAQIVNEVKEFAQRARLEELSRDNRDGINNAEKLPQESTPSYYPEYHWPSTWDHAQWNGEDYECPGGFSIDALGKGKAKSKGKRLQRQGLCTGERKG